MNVNEAKKMLETLPENTEVEIIIKGQLLISSQVEAMGISRQLLRYYVQHGYVRTVPHGKHKKYFLEDILKMLS